MPVLLFLILLAVPMELALWLTLHGHGSLGLLVLAGMAVTMFRYAHRPALVPVPQKGLDA